MTITEVRGLMLWQMNELVDAISKENRAARRHDAKQRRGR